MGRGARHPAVEAVVAGVPSGPTGSSTDGRSEMADVDTVRARLQAARQRRADPLEGEPTLLGAVVRMLDTPPVVEDPDER